MRLPIEPPYPPMEARTVEALPEDEGWQYEPKWDGFRCLVFRDGADVELQSKSEKSLTRYFPDVVEQVKAIRARQFVLDAEIVVVRPDGAHDFAQLLQRIHPAESRVRSLAAEAPASIFAFDLLAAGPRTPLVDATLERRRRRLEAFADRYFDPVDRASLSGSTRDRARAERWLRGTEGMDGVVAKRLDEPYRSGERAFLKVKRYRTADCVVGGFRYSRDGGGLGSLLLGLYDDEGLLHHVGFTSSFSAEQRDELLARVEPLIEPPGFTGNAPGGPSRWSTDRSSDWQPLRPELVVEVRYDHVTGDRFRHGTAFQRWRPDKRPDRCTLDQIR